MTYRDKICGYIRKKYRVKPEQLWIRNPNHIVFRHSDNGKWFGIIMDVARERIGADGEGIVDVLNLKMSDPLLADLLVQRDGFFWGYHFSRSSWISVLLDGTVPFKEVCFWIGESYRNTASAAEARKLRPPKEWLVPANPKYYDVVHAFDTEEVILWKQGAGIRNGDTVYLYVAAPVSAVLFQCMVTETNIPCRDEGELKIRSLMRIRLQKRYPPDRFTFKKLGSEYGIYAVRGPRGVTEELSADLRR